MALSADMKERIGRTEEILESILRGAAKILGCNSANLIVINEKTQEIRIRIGVLADQYNILNGIERIIGTTFRKTALRLRDAEDSLVYASWRNRAVYETSSMAELVGTAFSSTVVKHMASVIGDHRFICVPVASGSRIYGDIVFEKAGTAPFSPQQRVVLLRYAKRIGEIIENELQALGPAGVLTGSALHQVQRFLINRHGEIVGYHPTRSAPDQAAAAPDQPADPALKGDSDAEGNVGTIVEEAKKLFGLPAGSQDVIHLTLQPPYEAELSPILAFGEMHVLCTIIRSSPRPDASLQNQLLQLALAESAPTVLVDPEFHITSCNDSAAALFGYSADEILMKDIGFLFWEPLDIRTILNHQFLFLSNGFHEETAAVRPRDGRAVSCRIQALLLADEAYRVVGFLVKMRELRHHAPEPDDDADTRHLMRQERLATMGEMAAQLAHEIRNPLLAIGATLETLTHDLDLDPGKKAVVVSMMKEISRMDMILKDYLSLAARHSISLRGVRVADLLGDVRNLLHGKRLLSGKSVTLDVPQDLAVSADYEGLKHVFFNLFLNALEASPRDSTVACRAAPAEGGVTVVIEDAGPGFGVDTERYFEPFYTSKKNGTGLGLTVCRNIVSSHGGTITLGNREGGGARVSVNLPQNRRSWTQGT